MAAAMIMIACSKEEGLDSNNASKPVLKSTPASYESYDYPTNFQSILDDRLGKIEDEEALSDMSISEAIWTVEAGVNYIFAHPDWSFDSLNSSSLSIDFNTVNETDIAGSDINDAVIDVYNHARNNKPSDADIYLIDIKVDAVTGSSATITAEVVYAFGTSDLIEMVSIPSAQHDRKAGLAERCDNTPTSAFTYEYVAEDLAFRGYQGTKLYQNTGAYRPIMNVLRYGNTNINTSATHSMSSAKLFGQTGSVVSAYTSPSPKTTCLLESEQDDYADAMFDDFVDLNVHQLRWVLSVDVRSFEQPFNNNIISWYYHEVRVIDVSGAFYNANYNFTSPS